MWPAKTRFVQTPEAVYILHEVGPVYRIVWLNAKHPDDPDPQYWGHSIGWYENDDTLVVDTVGLNDRSWLDQLGHPRTEKLHFIERYTKVDDKTIRVDMTVDDPGAYTKPWPGQRTLTRSATGFLRYQWACSVRDNYENYEKVGKPGEPGRHHVQVSRWRYSNHIRGCIVAHDEDTPDTVSVPARVSQGRRCRHRRAFGLAYPDCRGRSAAA